MARAMGRLLPGRVPSADAPMHGTTAAASWRSAAVRAVCACVVALAWLDAPVARAGALADQFVETWTSRDGLPHSTVHGIGQSADGYLWLATWEGIVRYDGRDFRLYRRDDVPGLGDDGVRALHVGPRGDVWVGSTRGGIARWRDGHWTARPAAPSLITDLLETPDGALWVATARDGVVRFDPQGRRTAIDVAHGLPSGTVNALAHDARGRVWAATSHGLARLDRAGARAVAATGLPRGPAFSLYAGGDGRVLVGTEHGAYAGDGGAFAPVHPSLAGHTATRLWRDTDGSVWVGTNNAGLARVDGNRIEWLDTAHGLPNNRVLALRRDREGSLWVGTNGGLARVRIAPIRTFTRADGLADDFVRSTLALRGGGLLVGSGGGLDRLDADGSVRHVPLIDDPSGVSVLSLAEDASGDVLVGTFHHGVIRLRGGRPVGTLSMRDGLPSNEVRAMVAAPGGRLWLGTKQGLVSVDGRQVRVYRTRDGLPSEYVHALHASADGSLWVGTGLGAARMRDGVLRTVDLGSSDAHYVYGFMPSTRAGGMWLATDRGLVRIDARGRPARALGRAHGLPFEKIFALVADGRGQLWLTGNEGIARLRVDALERLADGGRGPLDVHLFGRADGMLSQQANGSAMPAATLDASGSLWVATAIGVARVEPAAATRRSRPLPPLTIEGLEVDGLALDPRARHALPPGDHRIVVRFATPALLDAQRVRYRYRLEGAATPWIDLGASREVQLTNLDPGDVRLRFEARVPGQEGFSAATLGLSVGHHWWQRASVWTALGLLAAAAAWAAYVSRIRALRRSEQRLRRLVDERTAALQVQTRIAEQLAQTDVLTMLANRRALDEALDTRFAVAASGHPISLVLLDVDGFKPINDLYGHGAGDTALRAVADVLRLNARAQDVAARWGGDEFAMVLVECDLPRAIEVAERIRQAIEALDCTPFAPGLSISASIGVASSDGTGASGLRRLVPRADEAVYRAKREGRNRVRAAVAPESVH